MNANIYKHSIIHLLDDTRCWFFTLQPCFVLYLYFCMCLCVHRWYPASSWSTQSLCPSSGLTCGAVAQLVVIRPTQSAQSSRAACRSCWRRWKGFSKTTHNGKMAKLCSKPAPYRVLPIIFIFLQIIWVHNVWQCSALKHSHNALLMRWKSWQVYLLYIIVHLSVVTQKWWL